jgi:aerobic-type carbon monoxide dehydrogenase small subunit (CoxS/CutS family)
MHGMPESPQDALDIAICVNGQTRTARVSARTHLADVLRQQWGLNGTRLGCEMGQCGACTVEMQGLAVRSCLTLAVQAHGCEVRTIEGMDQDPVGSALQEAFVTHHAMQCGYCTAGMIMSARDLLTRQPDPSREEIRVHLSGQYCRCTGYESIVNAVMAAARRLRGDAA